MYICGMSYEALKSLHIIFMVSWFAGLFYIVRLYIYHTEAQTRTDDERLVLSAQFEVMEAKLWWIITTPAMILTVVFGTLMLLDENHAYLIFQGWMHIKLGFVILLLFYHFVCQRMLFRLKKGIFRWTSNQLRMWNELATLVLVAVVFLVEMQHSLNWIIATLAFFGTAIGLMLGIRIYKKLRKS